MGYTDYTHSLSCVKPHLRRPLGSTAIASWCHLHHLPFPDPSKMHARCTPDARQSSVSPRHETSSDDQTIHVHRPQLPQPADPLRGHCPWLAGTALLPPRRKDAATTVVLRIPRRPHRPQRLHRREEALVCGSCVSAPATKVGHDVALKWALVSPICSRCHRRSATSCDSSAWFRPATTARVHGMACRM
ncbi:hypothetical protein VTK73DRAFT_4720 [Phialemonium thermophilum]|uniref:Uncharacterized protein n=1 Tax=Phialemonium thermophilum TaxID=223376 RepID=A0ABR3V6I6_9PEZI